MPDLGMGMMQKVESREWEEKQKVKVYQEFIMAPGTVHDKFYDSEGNYPWHQYCSITHVFICLLKLTDKDRRRFL